MNSNSKLPVFPTRMNSLLAVVILIASALPATAATTYLWSDASGIDMNWSTPGNWSPTGSPGTADTAIFGLAATTGGPTTINNIVSASTTVSALSYTNTTSG